MFQREVAERIRAAPATKAYGRLSVLAQSATRAKLLFDVSPRAFTPPPNVVSSVVQLTPMQAQRGFHVGDLERVTAAAFGQRRKMLRQSLRSLTADPAGLLAEAGLVATSRAEEVDIAGFIRLANAWRKQQAAHDPDPKPFVNPGGET
jgi:16S rRNA (adenine1518-N6/adenine1519-N6)-dimethyltransferase